MALGRATVNLPGGAGEPDLRHGDYVDIAADHPYVTSGYVVLEEQSLEEKTRDELLDVAAALGLEGLSGKRKDEIVSAITAAEAPSPPAIAGENDAGDDDAGS